MAENIRGTGLATTAQEKNKKDMGPGDRRIFGRMLIYW